MFGDVRSAIHDKRPWDVPVDVDWPTALYVRGVGGDVWSRWLEVRECFPSCNLMNLYGCGYKAPSALLGHMAIDHVERWLIAVDLIDDFKLRALNALRASISCGGGSSVEMHFSAFSVPVRHHTASSAVMSAGKWLHGAGAGSYYGTFLDLTLAAGRRAGGRFANEVHKFARDDEWRLLADDLRERLKHYVRTGEVRGVR